MTRLAIALLLAPLAGCAGSATAYPLNAAAVHDGAPKVAFVRYGTDGGPITVTMPDGEVLKGQYRVISNAAIGYGFAGTQMVTTAGFGGGSPVMASAVDQRGTMMNCQGAVDLGGHGALDCSTNDGARWRMMF